MEMKTQTPMISKWTAYLSIATLAMLFFLTLRSCFMPAPQLMQTRITEVISDSVKHWKDAADREHAQRIIAQADLASLQFRYGPLMDSIMTTLRIQGKQLEQITTIGLESTGRVYTEIDTVIIGGEKVVGYRGTDGYLTLNGHVGTGAFADYKYQDSLAVVAYWKRRPFKLWRPKDWGKKDLTVDAWSMNKNARITGLQSLHVVNDPFDRFNLDAYGSYGQYGNDWQVGGGLSLRYNFTRRTAFELAGEYNFNDNLGLQRNLTGRLRYNLIKF